MLTWPDLLRRCGKSAGDVITEFVCDIAGDLSAIIHPLIFAADVFEVRQREDAEDAGIPTEVC